MNNFVFSLLCFLSVNTIAQPYFEEATINLPDPAISGNTMDVQVSDFNGDGFPDIVLAKEYDRNRILFNDGTGNFIDATLGRLTNVNRDSEDIVVTDLDGNGWPDIVFATEDDAIHEIYLNSDSGNFTDESDRLPNFVANAVVSWDINGDGFPDLIFGCAGQNRIFINDGNAFFTDETSLRFPDLNDITQDLLLTDVDNDGDMDIAIGNEDGNRLLVNDGNGVFTDESVTRLPQGINMETRKVSGADINGDGFEDLFYSNMASVMGMDIRDRLYLNNGSGFFTDVTDTHLPSEILHTFDAVFTDLNYDNFPDLIIGYHLNIMPATWINDGNGHFSDQTTDYLPNSATGNNIAVLVADFNGDGEKDLYTGRFQQSDKLFFRLQPPSSTPKIESGRDMVDIYPNPSNGMVKLELSGFSKDTYHVEIFNELGQKVGYYLLTAHDQIHTIQLENQPAGIYLFKISNPIHSTTKKVIIQNSH